MNPRKIIAVSLLITSFLVSCATPPSERARLPGELSGWKLGHKQRDRLTQSTVWEYIPEGDYISKWTKKYTVQFYDGKRDDPKAFMEQLKSQKARVCPTIQSRILEQGADSILYDWRIQDCKRYKDQHEVARIIRGTEGMHRIAYTEKTLPMPPETYERWKKKLFGAWLETGSQ